MVLKGLKVFLALAVALVRLLNIYERQKKKNEMKRNEIKVLQLKEILQILHTLIISYPSFERRADKANQTNENVMKMK